MELKNKTTLVVLFSILAITLSFYLILPNLTALVSKNTNDSDNVKLGTFAICEPKENYILCKDKIFAACNRTQIEVNDTIFYCNGKKYNVSNLSLGETYHLKNWTDPRPKNFITAWATSE